MCGRDCDVECGGTRFEERGGKGRVCLDDVWVLVLCWCCLNL